MYWTHSELQKTKRVEVKRDAKQLSTRPANWSSTGCKGIRTSCIVHRADTWNFIMKVTMQPVYNSKLSVMSRNIK